MKEILLLDIFISSIYKQSASIFIVYIKWKEKHDENYRYSRNEIVESKYKQKFMIVTILIQKNISRYINQ